MIHLMELPNPDPMENRRAALPGSPFPSSPVSQPSFPPRRADRRLIVFPRRADHGGRDRHACFGVEAVAPISDALKARGIPFTMSKCVL